MDLDENGDGAALELDEHGRPEPPTAGDETTMLLLDRLAVRTWPDGRAPSLRWILLHMIEEYARHNGHADLLREAVDGETGE